MPRLLRTRRSIALLLTGLVAFGLATSLAHEGQALIFATDEIRPSESAPPDFPYWDSVVQRRYQAPSAIYLGAGWAITARHVGHGELIIQDKIFKPDSSPRHTLLNLDGSTADGLLFKLADNGALPDLPLIPIAKRSPEIGDEVLLIGFGRVRQSQIVGDDPENPFAVFAWSETKEKHWGTNRIEAKDHWLYQQRWTTRTLVMTFTPSFDPNTTPHEASAAEGDSGGALFAKMDGEWVLAGLLISVSSVPDKPSHATAYGDTTFAADLSFYRDDILRWARPECSNEADDDGDEMVDFPSDPDCKSPEDERERAASGLEGLLNRADAGWLGVACALTLLLVWRFWDQRRVQRGRKMPDSTSSSSAT